MSDEPEVFNPDTVFAWDYKISDQVLEGQGTKSRWLTMPDGTEYGGTYDFSSLRISDSETDVTRGDYIILYLDGSVGLTWMRRPAIY